MSDRPIHLRQSAICGNSTKCGKGGITFTAPISDDPAEATCKSCLKSYRAEQAWAEMEALTVAASPVAANWAALREHIRQERTTQDQLAADHEESGHDWQTERAYGAVETLDRLLATMERLEAGQ